MTKEEVRREVRRDPFVPLRLHVAGGRAIDLRYPNSAFFGPDSLLVVQRLAPDTHRISRFDVVPLDRIERIERLGQHPARAG